MLYKVKNSAYVKKEFESLHSKLKNSFLKTDYKNKRNKSILFNEFKQTIDEFLTFKKIQTYMNKVDPIY